MNRFKTVVMTELANDNETYRRIANNNQNIRQIYENSKWDNIYVNIFNKTLDNIDARCSNVITYSSLVAENLQPIKKRAPASEVLSHMQFGYPRNPHTDHSSFVIMMCLLNDNIEMSQCMWRTNESMIVDLMRIKLDESETDVLSLYCLFAKNTCTEVMVKSQYLIDLLNVIYIGSAQASLQDKDAAHTLMLIQMLARQ
jgi:hypothetical protein